MSSGKESEVPVSTEAAGAGGAGAGAAAGAAAGGDGSDAMAGYAISLASIRAAAARVTPHVHRTPVLTCRALDASAAGKGLRLFVKCENLQKTGSFKARGACNAIFSLSAEAAARGVITHSSGNHGQGVAAMAQARGVPAHIVMPNDAPAVKVAAVKGYGAKVTQVPRNEREATVESLLSEGFTFIHPSNNPDVMSGQGTATLEILEQVAEIEPREDDGPVVDAVVVPVGGGGLGSGTCIAAKSMDPRIKVFAGEPAACDDAARSLAAGSIQGNDAVVKTVADGLITTLGSNTWPVFRDYMSGIVVVSEEETIAAMRLVWERMKIIIEPSSAVAVAAALSPKFAEMAGPDVRRVAIIISGGNVDLGRLPWQH